jgi:hypothetical protein
MRFRKLCTMAFLTSAFVWTYSEGTVPVRATVGWCASGPNGVADVTRRGYNINNQQVNGPYGDDWTWHDGGRNTAQDCIDDTRDSIAWCTFDACNQPGTDPRFVCAVNSSVWRVDSILGQVLWNPDGYEAFQQNGGTAIAEPLLAQSYCCAFWNLNCP